MNQQELENVRREEKLIFSAFLTVKEIYIQAYNFDRFYNFFKPVNCDLNELKLKKRKNKLEVESASRIQNKNASLRNLDSTKLLTGMIKTTWGGGTKEVEKD